MFNFFFSKSERGKDKLHFSGFSYNLRKQLELYSHWRCVDRKCSGSCMLENNIITILKEHNHEPDFLKTREDEIKSLIKERSLSTREKPSDIVEKIFSEENQIVIANFPKKSLKIILCV
jgi:hypothetical protein